ncbi:unnamed protein product [Dibothriocephalus latus]|uniref:Equilibrative nucleoside transporter 3 n=1 Tax=Dibothriocephalus latus TaxID=60516 RepID=A0A3P7KXZ3_DIBLA|nr:unnamed protein product [Dibothriocephalus latus]
MSESMKDKTDEKIDVSVEEPKDRFHVVYIIFFFIGVGTLLPWNFFITADSYFKYQLRNRSLLPTENPLAPEHRTEEQKLFANNIALCTMIPLAFTNFANLILKEYLSARIRVFSCSVLVLAMFTITVVLTKVVVVSGLFSHSILNSVGSSIVQGSTYGILSMLPESNTRGFLEGQAVAGITAAVANLITISVAADLTNVGLIYFLIAVFIIALTLVLFTLLFRSTYYKFHVNRAMRKVVQTDQAHGCTQLRMTIRNLFKAMWDVRLTGFCAFFVFVVTLAIFPSLLLLVVPNDYSKNSPWKSTYFIPVSVFLSFNVSDYIGRAMVAACKWPKFSQKKLLLAICIIRAVLVPFAMFFNQQPRQNIPAVFIHEAFPIILVIVLGLSNGYLMSLSVTYASQSAPEGSQESCGIATATYISFGLCMGVAVSYGLVAAI